MVSSGYKILKPRVTLQTKGSVPLRLLCATALYQTMEDRDASVADAALKRVSVPQYSTDATKHDEYLERLRAHLHLIPESVPGFKHDIVLHGIPQRFIPPPAG